MARNGDCASGICATGTGAPFCTRTCTTDESCGGFSCIPTEDGMVHVCVPPGTAGPTPYAAPEGTPDDVRTLYGKNNCSAAPGAPGPVPASLTVLLILLAGRLHDRRRRRRSA